MREGGRRVVLKTARYSARKEVGGARDMQNGEECARRKE